MPTATVSNVELAPTIPGNSGPSVPVGSSGRAMVDGDPWTVLESAEQIAAALAAVRLAPSGRGRVLSALHLAGYWPTAAALTTYLEESR